MEFSDLTDLTGPPCERVLVFRGDDSDRCEEPFRTAFQLHMLQCHLPDTSDGSRLWKVFSHNDDEPKGPEGPKWRPLCQDYVYNERDNVVVDVKKRISYYLDEDRREHWRDAPQVLAALRCPVAVERACAFYTRVVHVPPDTHLSITENGVGGETYAIRLDKDKVLEDLVRGRPYRGVWTERVGTLGIAKVESLIQQQAWSANAEFAAIKECPHAECFCKEPHGPEGP